MEAPPLRSSTALGPICLHFHAKFGKSGWGPWEILDPPFLSQSHLYLLYLSLKIGCLTSNRPIPLLVHSISLPFFFNRRIGSDYRFLSVTVCDLYFFVMRWLCLVCGFNKRPKPTIGFSTQTPVAAQTKRC